MTFLSAALNALPTTTTRFCSPAGIILHPIVVPCVVVPWREEEEYKSTKENIP